MAVLVLYLASSWSSKRGGKVRFDTQEVRQVRGVQVSRAALEEAYRGEKLCVEFRLTLKQVVVQSGISGGSGG